MSVSVLFARRDSVYKELCDDVWDQDRDARNWPGGNPAVCHPPCAQWGLLASFANDVPEQKALAPFAIEAVRKFGGVVEHPWSSRLWAEMSIPSRGTDAYGGWLLPIAQKDFGHKAEKKTGLYIVGCSPYDLPALPLVLGEATHVIGRNSRCENLRPEVTKAERERTPPDLAKWLIAVAERGDR